MTLSIKLANDMGKQRAADRALDRAEMQIAHELCGYTIECAVNGREKSASVYDSEGCLVASFRALSWDRVIAAARGWNGGLR